MNDIVTKLQNIPLVKSVNIQSPVQHGSVFFGVGLMTSRQIGVRLPFDILGMFFVSELIRRSLKLDDVIVIIADTHALTNNIIPSTTIEQFAIKVDHQINKIIHNFALSNFHILRASQIQQDPAFQDLLNSLPTMENEYLRLETADCLWLKQKFNLQLKLGWTMSKTDQAEGNDERFFDIKIKEFIPKLNFVHLEPGWTFDRLRPRVSPYISIADENRLVLNRDQIVHTLGQSSPHLAKIVRCAEILWGKLPHKTINDKVQFILDKAIA